MREFKPEKWVLVPREPTKEMEDAARANSRDWIWEEIILAAPKPPIDVAQLLKERDKLRKMDQEAAQYVESVICLRTDFSGEPPYIGWKGLGIALTEALDERDALREQVKTARRQALEEAAIQGCRHMRSAIARWLGTNGSPDAAESVAILPPPNAGSPAITSALADKGEIHDD